MSSSFNCILSIDSQEFRVVHCAYEFNQPTGAWGRISAKVRSGVITLHLDVPDNSTLLAWAADPHKKLSGSLIFHRIDRPMVSEKLTFEEGFCVSYEEIFTVGSTTAGAYQCVLQISAANLTLGAVEKESIWVQKL
jgi:hypothetical protein